jgi:WD40 repeat protein
MLHNVLSCPPHRKLQILSHDTGCFVSDLTGSQDGSVQMWEWGHVQTVSVPRPPGTFAKVTRVRFSEHGNKFGVADGDGNLSLWQVGLASNASRPFFVSCSLHILNLTSARTERLL